MTKAFPDMPVKVNVRSRMPRGGDSDHASFNQVGVPGFFWDEVGQFVPASLDLFHKGALVPRSVTPNAHPPGVML